MSSLKQGNITFTLAPPGGRDDPAIPPSTKRQLGSYARKKLISIKATKRILAPYVKARRKPREALTENKTFSFYLQKKPSILMKEMSQWCLAYNLQSVMSETAQILGFATDSKVANVYMVDDTLDEIYVVSPNYDEPNRGSNGSRIERRVSYKIETGTTVAAHVAYTKQIIKINDLLEDIRFPQGLGNLEVTVKGVICVPVITYEGDCLAVFELYRDIDEDEYDENDLYLAVVMSAWVGSTIHQNQMQLTLQKQHKLTEYLQQLTLCFFDDASLLDKLIAEVINFAKIALDAEHGLFYVFRNNIGDIVADEYEDREYTEQLLKRKNIPIGILDDADILKVIARAAGIMNIRNCANDYRVRRQQKKRFYRIRAIIAAPIKIDDHVLGLIQIINKKDVPYFTKSDEVLLKTFSEYCGLVLKFARRSDVIKRQVNLNHTYEHMLSCHMMPCVHDTLFLINHMEPPYIPEDIDTFEFFLPETLDQYAPQYIIYMMEKLVDDMFENMDKSAKFVLTVKKAFRNLPYHNFKRSFHVFHCMYNLLSRCCVFSPIEVKGLLLASYCYGVDYNGYSSTFFEVCENPLAYLYEDGSLLQQHNYFILSLIIKFVDVFTHMSTEDYKELMEEIRVCLLSTDLAFLFKRRTKLHELHHTQRFDLSIGEHRLYLKSVMMGVAIFAYYCKPYHITMHLVQELYKEFYKEGDQIKNLGLCPLSKYDRDKPDCVGPDQITFLTGVVLPNTTILSKFIPSCEVLTKEAVKVREAWEELINTHGQKVWTLDESIPRKKNF